jgi:hypothetical protein
MCEHTSISTALGLGLCLCLFTAACGDRAEVVGGMYEASEARGHDPADEMMILATSLDIDRDSETATFTLHDGTVITSSLTGRPHGNWPSGCPGSGTTMEILSLDGPLMIESLQFMDPVLIASCPDYDPDVYLTEDGVSNYGGVPCESTCLHFRPAED